MKIAVKNNDELMNTIKSIIRQHKIRLYELQIVTGYHYSSFSRWLNKNRTMHLEELFKLCDALGITIELDIPSHYFNKGE